MGDPVQRGAGSSFRVGGEELLTLFSRLEPSLFRRGHIVILAEILAPKWQEIGAVIHNFRSLTTPPASSPSEPSTSRQDNPGWPFGQWLVERGGWSVGQTGAGEQEPFLLD